MCFFHCYALSSKVKILTLLLEQTTLDLSLILVSNWRPKKEFARYYHSTIGYIQERRIIFECFFILENVL